MIRCYPRTTALPAFRLLEHGLTRIGHVLIMFHREFPS